MTPRVGANKPVFLAPKAAFHSFQGKQLMSLPFGIADYKYRTGTSTAAQVDDEEKSPFRFGNPRFRPPELIAQHLAGLHKAQPPQYSYIYLRALDERPQFLFRSGRLTPSLMSKMYCRTGIGT